MSNAEDNTIDIVTQTSYRITDELNAIDAAVAAAVLQEREACAKVADNHAASYKANGMYPAYGLDGMTREAEHIAAAIRARNG